jgi:hypothetical protein
MFLQSRSLDRWQTFAFRGAARLAFAACLVAFLGGAPAVTLAGPCDVYASGGTPCVAAHSTTRALYSSYSGSLYQVRRWSDSTTKDIGVLSAGGRANAATQDSFCSGTYCSISKIYDQSGHGNHLTVAPGGGANPAHDYEANAAALPLTVGGNKVYGVYVSAGVGYRNNATSSIPKGSASEGTYAVFSGTHVNDRCCFDYGNAETNNLDNGNGHMDAVYFGRLAWFSTSGSGPWVMADLENGLFLGGNGSNSNNTGRSSTYVTAMTKQDATTYSIRDGNAQSGSLKTDYAGALPTTSGYVPFHKEGGIILGIGGDNSNGSVGSFYEGAIVSGKPSDGTEASVQANIVAAGYGNPSTSFPVVGTAYRITNVTSGKVLDAVNCGTANGTLVDQWSSLGNTCQQWRFSSAGTGVYTITNVNSGKVLDAMNCGLADGTTVDLWSNLGNNCQKWAVIPGGNGKYMLVVENSGMVLDDKNCGTANGTSADLWQWLDNTCQLWTIAP